MVQSCQCDDLCQPHAEMPALRQQMPHYNPCRAAMKYAGRDLVQVSWSVVINSTGAMGMVDLQGSTLTFKILRSSSAWLEYAPCLSQTTMTRAHHSFPRRLPFAYIVTAASLRGWIGLSTLSLRTISLQRLWSGHSVKTRLVGMRLQSRCRQTIYYLRTLAFHPSLLPLLLFYNLLFCIDFESIHSLASTKSQLFFQSHSFTNHAFSDTPYHQGPGLVYTGSGKLHNRG